MNQHSFFTPVRYSSADSVYSSAESTNLSMMNATQNSMVSSWTGTNTGTSQSSISTSGSEASRIQGTSSLEKRRPLRRMHENKPAEVITPEQHHLSIKDSPSYYLGLFIDSNVMTWLITKTNIHGETMKQFAPVTEDEMRCFIAILYLSGYLEVPRRRMLWERAPDSHCPLVSNAMQRDRFESIFAAIQVDGAKTDAANLAQIQPLVNLLNERFLRHLPADDQHSIAQCTISSFFKHHNAKAPIKTLKAWCACTKIGYCTWFSPVTSPLNSTERYVEPRSVILHYANLARRLQINLNGLLFENCYLESTLIYELRKLGIQGSGVDREKTGCLLNPPLGGVDKLDCNLNLYRSSMYAKKSYSAVLTFCLDVALSNAWQLYKIQTQDKKPLDLLGFRRNVVVYYLQHYARAFMNRKGGRPAKVNPNGKRPAPSDARFDGIRHYVIPQDKQTRCARCSMKTTTRCQKCDIGVHVKCFVEFHTRPRQAPVVEVDPVPKFETLI